MYTPPLTLGPNMSDISQVELAGAAVVAGGAAVTGVVPDPSQAVGATEKCNILHSNCIFVVKLIFFMNTYIPCTNCFC